MTGRTQCSCKKCENPKYCQTCGIVQQGSKTKPSFPVILPHPHPAGLQTGLAHPQGGVLHCVHTTNPGTGCLHGCERVATFGNFSLQNRDAEAQIHRMRLASSPNSRTDFSRCVHAGQKLPIGGTSARRAHGVRYSGGCAKKKEPRGVCPKGCKQSIPLF